MSGNRREDLIVNTLIGPGTRFEGELSVAGFVRIDGELKGRLKATGRVIIGEKARLESDVEGTAIVIGGVVKGNVFASERVTILSSGMVIGDIITCRIQIDDGVVTHGRVIACGAKNDWERRLAEYLDARALAGDSGDQTHGQG